MLIDRGTRKSKLAPVICALITRLRLLMCRDDAADPFIMDLVVFATYSRFRHSMHPQWRA
jgi:hypothetical protein